MLRSRLHPTSTVYPAGMARQVLSCLMATATGCRHSIVSYATDFRLFRSSQSHSDQLEGGPSMQSSRRQIATTPSARPSIFTQHASCPHPDAGRPLFFFYNKIAHRGLPSLQIYQSTYRNDPESGSSCQKNHHVQN